MKVRIVVGPVEVAITGLDVTERQVRRLLADAGQIATRLLDEAPEPEPEERAPMGFAATVERSEPLKPEAYFTDDDE